MGIQGVRRPRGSGVSQSTKVITLCQERAQCLQHLSAAVVHVLMSYIFLIFIFLKRAAGLHIRDLSHHAGRELRGLLLKSI